MRDGYPAARLIALERRTGKAENDTRLLREARGAFCLLLNEDTELREGATRALLDALEGDPRAAAAGAQLLTSEGEPTACAWRLPNAGWALAGALFMHDSYAVQSRGDSVRRVGWVQSSAMLVRREAAEQVDWLDPDFFVYSDETDFCRRLRDAGWRILFVPQRRGGAPRPAVHRRRRHAPAHRRVPPRPRPLLPQAPHAGRARALAGLLDLGVPGAGGGRDRAARPQPAPLPDARAPAAQPGHGEGLREIAEEYNRRRADGLARG